MRQLLTGIIERDLVTGVLVGSVPGLPGAHTQGSTIREVRENLEDVLRVLVENGALQHESEFIAVTRVTAP